MALTEEQEVVVPLGGFPDTWALLTKAFPSLAELTVAWLDLPRFARKGLNECTQCLTNYLLGAEMWGQL